MGPTLPAQVADENPARAYGERPAKTAPPSKTAAADDRVEPADGRPAAKPRRRKAA
jgi:hypothetical protein